MAEFDVDDPTGWWEMDDNADDDQEMIPMETLQEKDTVIGDMLTKFGGNLDDTEQALMRLQLSKEDGSWFYNTELRGQAVKVKLTGGRGQVLARSTIQKAKGGADFFEALGPDREPRRAHVPLEPTIVDRQPAEVSLQQEIEMAIDDEQSPLRPEDRRELRGVATTLASTSSKVKAAEVNREWAKTELGKARRELRDADDDQIEYWEAEVNRFEAQEILYRRTHEVLQQRESSQLSRMKALLRNLKDDTRPIGERLRELFEKEGITIVSLAAAVIMTVTAIGLGISNAVRTVVTPSSAGKPSGPSFRERVRDALRKLAGYLKELAKKGAAALPGLIGTVVSFVLRKAGEVVGFLAEHLVILVIAMVALVLEAIVKIFPA